ncbi:hypothetical protein ACWD1Y_42190 [Streptomyces sp. NPDC002814]
MIAAIEYEGDTTPPLSAPGRVVTEAEYLAARNELQDQIDARRAAAAAAELEAKQGAYEALINAGIADAAARQISGYKSPTATW